MFLACLCKFGLSDYLFVSAQLHRKLARAPRCGMFGAGLANIPFLAEIGLLLCKLGAEGVE